jgi:hypothetical protein
LGAIRNTDLRLYPFGAFAFYFFIRFHLHKEAWPGLHKFKDWDRIKLLSGEASERERPLNYTTHNSWIHKGFKQIGLINSKTTQGGNRAQWAEILGVPEEDVST